MACNLLDKLPEFYVKNGTIYKTRAKRLKAKPQVITAQNIIDEFNKVWSQIKSYA